MKIRCWGARGSIAVSGREYIKYGGDTPCLQVTTAGGKIIIIDAGTGIRRLGNHLIRHKQFEYTLLFTHAHWDHIMGFPFFRPLYRSGTKIGVYGCPFAQRSVKKIISTTMRAPNFPINLRDARAEIHYHGLCDREFAIDGITITPIVLSHPNQGLGYRFEENGKSFVFLTDNELAYRHRGSRPYTEYLAFTQNADLLIHDAEFTPAEYKRTRTWGHSTVDDALKLALTANVKSFGLYHHNQDRTDRQLDTMVKKCRTVIRRKKVKMKCFAVAQDWQVTL